MRSLLVVPILLAILCQPALAQEPIQLPASFPECPATALAIPAISLFRPVEVVGVDGDTWDTDQVTYCVMHLQGTVSPGEAGNVVLAGHYTLPDGMYGCFHCLDMLRAGDRVLVYSSNGRRYTYIVELALVVGVTDMWVVTPTERPTLTLLTCHDWDPAVGRYAKRLIVRARLRE